MAPIHRRHDHPPGIEPLAGSFLIDGGANTYADFTSRSAMRTMSARKHEGAGGAGNQHGGRTASRDGRADRWMSVPIRDKRPDHFCDDVEGLMAAKDYAGLIGAEFSGAASTWFSTSK